MHRIIVIFYTDIDWILEKSEALFHILVYPRAVTYSGYTQILCDVYHEFLNVKHVC